MKAVIGHQLGAPDQYQIEGVPTPSPGPGQVRVRVVAAGIGYFDALAASGRYQVKPPTPFIPGSDFSGVVDSVGKGVNGIEPGDRVTASTWGGVFAEYACVPAETIGHLPAGLSFEKGAVIRVNYSTAYHALKDRAGLAPGQTLLVMGAAGGVGSAAVQVGRMMGARVLAAASNEQKRAFALQCGADEVLDHTKPDFRDVLKSMTDGRGVDVIIDPVAGPTFEPAFRSLAWKGRHLVIGFAGGPIPALPINLALLKGASLIGVDQRQFELKEPADAAHNQQQLDAWFGSGAIDPPVGMVFPFEEFRAALTLASSREGQGKVVLKVALGL